ncbi:hypothetical protein HHK36_021376 [Tetracentron sinense]|uniref:Leucine-rich repeat-containing N-terminal plant-type domain-containing protein n=1 Tax=Tetracentron sinense TaxID=13715 RepID=A0A834YTP1_TETSI|nr:hypothetical protein HHK36_021376 [Tetracentron sinense]
MERHLLIKFLLWVSLVLLELHGYLGCLDEERIALLEFKASVNWIKADHGPLLHTWFDDIASDCCTWERLKCNRTTARVIDLELNDTRQSYDADEERIWFLNMALFLPFQELQHLDLSRNSFDGWVMNEGLSNLLLENNDVNIRVLENTLWMVFTSFHTLGFERLSTLKRLEFLNLGGNRFNNSILQSLGALTSLKTLILIDNRLEGSFPAQELAALSNLQMLDLSLNGLNDSCTDQELGTLSNLEILDLSYNKFVGSIPLTIAALTSLAVLSLGGNTLNDSQPIQGLCELKNLEELDLSVNNFEGILPPCLKNLTSLRMLDLSWNHFRGNIPSSIITSLSSLEYISLSHNHFEGTFLFNSFANHSKLEVVELLSDDGKLEVETQFPTWIPTFQLKILIISNCKLNKYTGAIPEFISNQYNLRIVDLFP